MFRPEDNTSQERKASAVGQSLIRWMSAAVVWIFLLSAAVSAEAAPQWKQVSEHIHQTIRQSLDIYESGDPELAKKTVNDAYYGIYEKDGLEKAIRSTIAAKNANLTEYQFSKVKKLMTSGSAPDEVKAAADTLLSMIDADVKALEGAHAGGGGWASFWPAFLILLREGMEAILMLAAIMAYLYKSGNQKYLGTVYNYSIAAVAASFITAYVFNQLIARFGAGANQEIAEGMTALLAVGVLLSVSVWMGGKSSQKAWDRYLKSMMSGALSAGKARALGLAAFLAVYREGAEVILFYQALFNSAAGDVEMIWLGFAAGCAALAVIFGLIHYGLIRIPLRPFFAVTSVLMFLMAVSFTGSGISELQEGGVINATPVESAAVPSIDWMGVYPTYETLGAQAVLILAAGTVLAVRYAGRSRM